MFEPSVYLRRRQALCAAVRAAGVPAGTILLPGNGESPVNYADNAYRFRQDSSFLYCIGLAEPDMAALIDIESGRTVLFADELTMDMLVWTGPRPKLTELAAAAALDEVRPFGELAAAVQAGVRGVADGAAGHGSTAAAAGLPLYLPPYRAATVLQLARLLALTPELVMDKASLPLIRAFVAVREIKDELEIAEHERAVDISVDMHRAVLAMVGPGRTESELMAEAVRVALAGGGMPSFQPIATRRGAVLHNHGYTGVLAAGDLFLLDAGAETLSGYAGDLTSTMPVSGRYDSRQKAVYQLVLDAGRTAAALLRPGLPFLEAHLAAARTITAGLQALGLMRGDIDASVAAGAHALFFPHGLGHQMGLDVHDMEALGENHVGYGELKRSSQFGLRSLRLAKPLRSGMVLTVEPGIYFIEGLIDDWQARGHLAEFIDYPALAAWRSVGGFRNEEDWLITADAARRLGKPFDKSVAAMERA